MEDHKGEQKVRVHPGWVLCIYTGVMFAVSGELGAGRLCVPVSTLEYATVLAAVIPMISAYFCAFNWLRKPEKSQKSAGLASVVAVLFVCASVLWGLHESFCRIPAVKVAFVRGTPTAPSVHCSIDHGDLSTVVTPNDNNRAFHLLQGPPGSGKTHLLERVCHDAGKGVIYVKVPFDATDFHKILANKINFNFNEHAVLSDLFNVLLFGRSTEVPQDVYAGTSRTLNAITQAAKQLKHELGTPVVLVIDDVARLARASASTFELLVHFAKARADDGTVTVVFSSNDAVVNRLLWGKSCHCHVPLIHFTVTARTSLRMPTNLDAFAFVCCFMLHAAAGCRSAVSRLGSLINLGDIPEKKARNYLTCRGLTDERIINATINMTGRRIILMEDVVWKVFDTPGSNLEGTCTATTCVCMPVCV